MTTTSASITRKQLNPVRGRRGRARNARSRADGGRGGTGARLAQDAVRILELPEHAQHLIGEGAITLSAVDHPRALGANVPALPDAVIADMDDGQRVGGRAPRP